MENKEPIILSIQDIAVLKTIVEIASSRGAFRADELSTVGTIYDRVSQWIAQNTTQEESEETSEDQGESND